MSSISSMLVRPFIRFSVKFLFRPSVSINTQRFVLDLASNLPLPKSVTKQNVQIDGLPCEWIEDESQANNGVILYLHGGGYNIGSCASYRLFAATLSRACATPVLLVDYRLAPEHKFPAPIDDAIVAYEWLLDEGYSAEEILIAGDSAGGGLALATAMVLRDEDYALPGGCICLSPWADLQQTGDSMKSRAKQDPMLSKSILQRWADNYIDLDDNPANPLISPINGDYEALPPLFIQVGDDEVLLSDAQRITTASRAAGVPTELEIWPRMWHDWQQLAIILPEAKEAIKQIATFVTAQLHVQTRQPLKSGINE